VLLAKHYPGDEIKEAKRRRGVRHILGRKKWLQNFGGKTSKADAISRIQAQIRVQFINRS
jgi:hypothetical protein